MVCSVQFHFWLLFLVGCFPICPAAVSFVSTILIFIGMNSSPGPIQIKTAVVCNLRGSELIVYFKINSFQTDNVHPWIFIVWTDQRTGGSKHLDSRMAELGSQQHFEWQGFDAFFVADRDDCTEMHIPENCKGPGSSRCRGCVVGKPFEYLTHLGLARPHDMHSLKVMPQQNFWKPVSNTPVWECVFWTQFWLTQWLKIASRIAVSGNQFQKTVLAHVFAKEFCEFWTHCATTILWNLGTFYSTVQTGYPARIIRIKCSDI